MNVQLIKWDAGPATVSTFAKTLHELKHPLPWHASEEDYGVITDAAGDTVAIVDPDNGRTDEDAFQLALWIVTAVNTCAGFTAIIAGMEH